MFSVGNRHEFTRYIMKILFVVFFDPYDLGARHLAAFMRDKGHEVAVVALQTTRFSTGVSRPSGESLQLCPRVIKGRAVLLNHYATEPISAKTWEMFTETIAAWRPDLIGYGTRSINHYLLPTAIPAMRKGAPRAFLAAGGVGPTLDPDFSLALGVDAVIRGEGEYALDELVQAVAYGKDWRSGHNLAYLENGKKVLTPMLPLEKKLDAFPLPLPDSEELIVIENGRVSRADAQSKKDGTALTASATLLATRGCPADCSYCQGRALRNIYQAKSLPTPKYRRHSLERVLVEAVRAKNEGYAQILWCDEFFIYPVRELVSFFTEYRERVGLPFFANLSADQLAAHPELLDAAYNAHWVEFSFGLQTGSQSFCREVYNRKNNNENVLAAVKACVSRGMRGFLYMIAGNPLETKEDRQQTYDLLARFPAFDPSFKTVIGFTTTKMYMPAGDSPLKRKFPQLMDMQCDHNIFYRQAMLLELRVLLDDQEFNEVLDDKRYVKNPHLLGALFHDTLAEKHERHLTALLPTLEGQDCFFWGCGRAYQQKKDLFAHARSRAILYDLPGEAPASIDGIPVWHPDKAFAEAQDIPIVVFAHRLNCNMIHRKLLQRYNRADNVIFCATIE